MDNDKTILTELSPDELLNTTVSGFPNTRARQHLVNTVNISNIKYTPYIKNFTLRVDADAMSNSHHYKVTMLIKGVFYEMNDSIDVVEINGTNGEKCYINPIDMREPDVETRCTCPDFRWRFAVQNNQNDSLFGNPPPPYRKKTNRPPVNPQNVPGMCKHLIKLGDTLKQVGIVQR